MAFTDNNPHLHGQQVEGLMVYPPAEAARRYGKSAVFVITVYTDSAPGGIEPIIQILRECGCQNVVSFVPLYWKYAESFLPHYVYDLPHKVIEASTDVRGAFQLFRDPVSREEFFAQINWRLDPGYDRVPRRATHEIYFPPDLIRRSGEEVFVDCGAYNGDTIQSFLSQSSHQFSKVIALEPDPVSFSKLSDYVGSLPFEVSQRIQTRNSAVGREAQQLRFHALGEASSIIAAGGETVIQSEALDVLLHAEAPTFIKMDIEGAEFEALSGARETILAHLPVLAISAYHTQADIWQLPLLIHSFSPAYHFFLRRYTNRFLDDLVLYAIPAYRIKSDHLDL